MSRRVRFASTNALYSPGHRSPSGSPPSRSPSPPASSTLVGSDYASLAGTSDSETLNSPSLSKSYSSTVYEGPKRMADLADSPHGLGKIGKYFFDFYPARSPSRSPSPPIFVLDRQASSTPVGPDHTFLPGIPDIQSLNSPSLSNIYTSVGYEGPGRMADLASAGFESVKTTLCLIESATDLSPPLKLTVTGLLTVIDIMEITVQDQQVRQYLEQKLRDVVSVINNHAKYSTMPTFATRLEGLSAAMNYQLKAIQVRMLSKLIGMKGNRSLASRTAAGGADSGDITVAYRTLSYLFDAFLMGIALDIRTNMLEINTTTQTFLSNTLLNNLPRAKHAAYDDAGSFADRRSCAPKTRDKILADLVAWATDTRDTSIYWLNGRAGTGKTTIAFTFSQILDNLQFLGASFFGSRLDTDASNADLIFPSLAHELARHSTAVSTAVLNALEKDPNVGHQPMQDQFLNLIVTPTKVAFGGISTPRPFVIIIDGLDECTNQNHASNVLAIIRQYSPILPLKFFISSRSERQIQDVFYQEGNSKYILHNIDEDTERLAEAELRGNSDGVFSVAFSRDGSHVVSGSADNTIRIWNVKTGETEAELRGHSDEVSSVAFSPDGSRVVSGSADNTIRIWNVKTGETETELRGHLDKVFSVAFSLDGSRVVSGSADNTIRIWNVMTGKTKAELRGHSDEVFSVAFSPDGSRVVSGSADNTIRIWNVRTGESESELRGHSFRVFSVAFSPDGSRVVSGSADSTIRIWNVMTGETEAELIGRSSSFKVFSVAFSPDGSRVVSGSFDPTVCIWNVVTGEAEAELRGHLDKVFSVAFSPDGSRVVSGSADDTIRIWNVMTGETEAELRGHLSTEKTTVHCELPASSINVDSTSDMVKNDKSEHFLTTTCWIAAEHALQHVRNNISSVSEVFGRRKFQKSEYVVLAGFDESLIKSGVGYLEQVHVFVIRGVDPNSPLLSELGRLFSPFSSILFTESSSYRLPVCKDDGSEWEFDELVYYTASKFADGGSSAKTPLTIISICQNPSLPVADGTTGFAPSGSGSGEEESNKKQRVDKGKERDTRDNEEANNGERDSSGDPDDSPLGGDQDGPELSFDITSKIHLKENERKQIGFQTLIMRGTLTIKTTLPTQIPRQYSKRFVQFRRLIFNSELTTRNEIAYQQIHLRIVVDSHQEKAKAEFFKPEKTSYSDRVEKKTLGTKLGSTSGAAAGVNVGLNPQGTMSLSKTKTKEETANLEKTIHMNRIRQYDNYGKILWGFDIDDVYSQESGTTMREDDLPTVHFKFTGDSDKSNPPPTPPPEHMDIVITSYWKMTLPSESKNEWIRKLVPFVRSTGNTQAALYSNLFQIVALKASPDKLREECDYIAEVVVNPGASDPHKVKITRHPVKFVNVIPAVVKDSDTQNLIFSDEPDLHMVSDEANPQKPSLPIRLPTIAKFELSDDCIIWGNLDCGSSEAATK